MAVTSQKFSLNLPDYAKGFLLAFLAAFIATIGQSLEAWQTTPDFTFQQINFGLSVKAGIAAGIGYLIKNFFTKPETPANTNG